MIAHTFSLLRIFPAHLLLVTTDHMQIPRLTAAVPWVWSGSSMSMCSCRIPAMGPVHAPITLGSSEQTGKAVKFVAL